MSVRRRFEILLPLQFNDGKPVPDELLWQTVEELEAQFNGLSWESQVVRGLWHQEGVAFRDTNTRLIVDVEDVPKNRAFFVALKEVSSNGSRSWKSTSSVARLTSYKDL
jgi:hypothetical protein